MATVALPSPNRFQQEVESLQANLQSTPFVSMSERAVGIQHDWIAHSEAGQESESEFERSITKSEQWNRVAVKNGVQSVVGRLADLSRLEPNWDSYYAEPVSSSAIRASLELFVYLLGSMNSPFDAIPYFIAPIPDGGVEFTWRGHNRSLEVDISPTGAFGYLLIQGSEMDPTYEEDENVSMNKVLRKLSIVME